MNTTQSQPTFADDFRSMLNGWTKIEAAARTQFPQATEEQLYEICKGAMRRALGLTA